MLEKYHLRELFVKPAFSNAMLQIIKPSAATITPNLNFELAEYLKIITPDQCYAQNFTRLCNNQYHGYTKLYTDGSKRKVGVGAAVV